MRWQPVIGLEIHAQLATRSKMFSGAATAYGAPPNAQACAVDLALPGVLPVINRRAVEMAVTFGLAIGATIDRRSVFARKNYFYPDLPKGYQISQYEAPIVAAGSIEVALGDERLAVAITRAHLEEDAGKSLHGEAPGATAIDLNRAGTPLLEIVSEPVLPSAAAAVAYMREIHRLVRFLGICDGNMQEGSFRCDANVSVRPADSAVLGTRTEIKNLNSFRFVERAIEHEIERQIEVLEDGGEIVQETRLYDDEADETRSMRTKEDAHDYRYFPDPDLLPVTLEESLVERLARALPELPAAKERRYVEELGLGADAAAALTADPDTARYFESCLDEGETDARHVANWIVGELYGALNKSGLAMADAPVAPAALYQLVEKVRTGAISGKAAKRVFQAVWEGRGSVEEIIEREGLAQVSDSAFIDAAVDEVIAACPEQVEQFRAGKDKVLGFLVGQVLKRTQGKANPGLVNAALRDKLSG